MTATTTTSATIAPPTAGDSEAFEERLVEVINHGALALMLSIGHRTGLFDVLADGRGRTSDELATEAGLVERYVREWLGAMVTGEVVGHDPDRGTYDLPPAHAALLTRHHPTGNVAVFAQYVGLLGSVEDEVVACFREGGGVPYERFPRFQSVMEEDSGQTVLPALDSHILPLAEGVQDRLATGIRVADVGCGRGRALVQLARSYPRSTFVGYDISRDAVKHARALAAEQGLDNVTFEVADAAGLSGTVAADSFDLVLTFDAVHDQADPAAVLDGIRHVLADGGTYLAQDIDSSSSHAGDLDHPLGPLLYTISTMHCMTVSLAADGAGLGAMWGREVALQHLRAAGFDDVTVHTLDHDPQNAYYVCRA